MNGKEQHQGLTEGNQFPVIMFKKDINLDAFMNSLARKEGVQNISIC